MITADPTNNGPLAYPVFARNQVLSHAHLNRVVSYLDSQVRLTRATLIGTGIVCGFEPSLAQTRDQLTISEGCGITTGGYLIADRQRVLTHYRRAEVGSDDFPGETEDLQHEVYELFETESPDDVLPESDNPIVAFHQSQEAGGMVLAETLAQRIVVLVLDIDDEQRSSCIYDCDEAGIHRTLLIRALVFHRDDAETIIRKGYDPQGEIFGNQELEDVFNRKYYLPDLCFRRFGYYRGKGTNAEAQIGLPKIKNLKTYVSAYAYVTGPANEKENPISAIAAAYRQAGKAFSPFFSGFEPDSAADFEKLESRLHKLYKQFVDRGDATKSSERLHGIQYFYDYLKDLAQAYDELRTEAFDLMDDCMPAANRFSRHLMIGGLSASADCPPSVFRSRFTQPPIYNGNRRRLEHLRLLYERMKKMAANFRMDLDDGLATRVTPSRTALAPLAERAIPFYYEPESRLYETWSFERARRCRSEQNLSYYSIPPGEKADRAAEALLCDIDRHDFFRIEGHVGKEHASAVRDINDWRHRYNLPFDLIALKISILAENEEIDVDYVVADLELLYTKCRHSLVCVLEQMIENVDGDVLESIQELRQQLTREKDGSSGDFYDLVELSEEGRFETFSALYRTIFSSEIGQRYVCLGCDPASIQSILDAYRDRVRQIREQLLFHKFAEHHPGMEHLAGVPRGGTFILVYINEGEQQILKQVAAGALEKAEVVHEHIPMVYTRNLAHTIERSAVTLSEELIRRIRGRRKYLDAASVALEEAEEMLEGIPGGEELSASIAEQLEREVALRSNTVVGDFCLPYICCSEMPPVSYVVAQPKPIVLLESFTYCEDDSGPYTFILHPEGGRLDGPGVKADNGGYQFVPNHPDVLGIPADTAGKREVTFTYYAEGGVDTLTVEILPIHIAAFTIHELPPSGVICADPGGEPTRLLLEPETPGGTFETDGPELERSNGNVYLNPSTVAPGTEVRITYNLPASEDACANTSMRTITVGQSPDAGFSGLAESYCVNDGPVSLALNTTGSDYTSEFTEEWVEFVDSAEEFQFYPSRVEVGAGKRTVTITHMIVGPDDCPGSARQTVTVYATPDASFAFKPTLPDPLCVPPDAEGEQYRLVPRIAGGEFMTEIGGQTGTTGLVRDGETVWFRPAEVLPETTVKIVYTVGAGPGCSSTSDRTVTVLPMPDAGFTIDDSYCVNDEPAELIPDTSDPEVTSKFSGEGVEPDDQGGYRFNPANIEVGSSSRDVMITHTVSRGDVCAHTVRRPVTVHPLPDPRFGSEPGLPEVICVDPEAGRPKVFQLIPAVEGGKFTTVIDGEPGSVGLDETNEGVLFYPVRMLPATEATLVYEVTNPQGCRDRFSRTITLREVPKAGFAPIPGQVLVDSGPIELVPVGDTGASSRFTVSFGPFENVTRGIIEEGGTTYFDPSIVIQSDVPLPEKVTVIHTVADEWGCEGSSTQTVYVQRGGTTDGDGGIDLPGGGEIDLGGGDIVTDIDLTGGGGIIDVSGDFDVIDFGSPMADVDLSPEAAALFTDRRKTYAGTLRELALEDRALTDTKSFQMVNKYLEAGMSRPAPEAAKLYRQAMDVVLPVYKRAEEPRKSMYHQLIELATRGLLDRLVAESSSTELLTAAAREVSRIREAGMNLNAILANWQPGELRGAVPEANIDRFLSLLL